MSNALFHVVCTFRERLLAGFSWNVLSAVSLQGSVLLSSIVVARMLGMTSFGAYSILVSTVMTVAAIAQGGSGLVATKYVAEFLASEPSRVGRVLNMCRVFAMVMGACTAALLFAAGGLISGDLLGRPELATLVRLVAVAVFFQVCASYQFGALQGFGAFRELGRAGMLTGLGHIAFTTVGAWLGQLTGALLGFVVASGLRTTVFAYMLKTVRSAHGVQEKSTFNRTEFRLLWRFALPAGLAGFVTMPCLWLVTVMVARLPDGLGLAAMLSVAHQVRLAVLQLPSLLNAVSFAVLSRLKGLDETLGFRRVFWSNLALNLVFSTLVVAMLVLVAESVMQIFGRDFANGRWVLILLLVSVLPEMLAMTFYQLIQATGRMWHSLFLIAIPRDLIYLGLAFLLLPTFGLTAAAAAYLTAHAIGLVTTLGVARRFAPAAMWRHGAH